MATILHISDLHRSPDDPISNVVLVASILDDIARSQSEDPPVPKPDAIIVTGDIIQGVAVGTPNHREELDRQYNTAFDFLNELSDRLLDGARSRVIITNGNHDVDWNTAFASMTPVSRKDELTEIVAESRCIGRSYRWCWKTRQFYRIVNLDLYDRRFDAFHSFLARFYSGVPGLLRVQGEAEVNLFNLFEERVVVATFNSCYGNDCFASHGAIRPDVIARTQLDVNDLGFSELRIAIWHHSLDGPPYQTDYMDADIVRRMVGYGFRLGLHGHQHLAGVTPYSIQLPGKETMAVVRTGSLCAGQRELPIGINRQYNIIELRDNFRCARIHVREMTVGAQFSPNKRAEFGGQSYVDVAWSPPADVLGRSIDVTAMRIRNQILESENAFKSNNFERAISLLESIKPLVGHGRRILIDAAVHAKKWRVIIDHLKIPESINDLVMLVTANGELRLYDPARNALAIYGPRLGLPDATRKDLEKWLKGKEFLKND